jgi:hypothetical protein
LVNASTVESRRHQLTLLDQEHAAWSKARQSPPKDEPLGTANQEARRIVNLRYDADAAHLLYMRTPGGLRSTAPACQEECDTCHRITAIMNLRELCVTRSEFSPILDWIMDPGFLV